MSLSESAAWLWVSGVSFTAATVQYYVSRGDWDRLMARLKAKGEAAEAERARIDAEQAAIRARRRAVQAGKPSRDVTPPVDSWCQRCDQVRPERVMRWLDDDYLCAVCRSVDGVVYTSVADARRAARRAGTGTVVKVADGEFVAAISDRDEPEPVADLADVLYQVASTTVDDPASMAALMPITTSAPPCSRPCPCPKHRDREPLVFDTKGNSRPYVEPGSLVDQVIASRPDECDGKRGNHGDPLIVCAMCCETPIPLFAWRDKLAKKTKLELLEECRRQGVPVFANASKARIIDALANHYETDGLSFSTDARKVIVQHYVPRPPPLHDWGSTEQVRG